MGFNNRPQSWSVYGIGFTALLLGGLFWGKIAIDDFF
jgi:hypothetical protein